jgi:hypothetical protein
VYLRDIRFWIFLFFLVRLIGNTYPPIEVGHNWRQTTGTMVTRNFYEVNANPYYPKVDFGGEKTGITAMEFPLLNYLIYLFSLIFGYDHWYGRLINLIVSSCGLYYFYKLIKQLFNEPLAFASTVLLTCSIWFQFSRKIMPDTFAVSLLLISFYHVVLFLKSSTFHGLRLLAAALFFMCGAMSKLPAVIPLFALPLLYFTWPHRVRWSALLLVFAVASLPVLHWYFIWTDHLTEAYGMHHFFMGKNVSNGAQEISNHIGLTLHRVFIGPLKYIGGTAFLIGTAYAMNRKNKPLMYVLLLTGIALCLVILKSGETFYAHDYYIIPFVPVFALIVAYGISQLPLKWSYVALVIICLESVLNQYHDLRWKPSYAAFVQLESIMDLHTQPQDKIAVNCAPNPSTLYFAHRTGWICSNEELLQPDRVAEMQAFGLKYILICKTRFGNDLDLPSLDVLFENEQFRLYRLEDKRPSHGIAQSTLH